MPVAQLFNEYFKGGMQVLFSRIGKPVHRPILLGLFLSPPRPGEEIFFVSPPCQADKTLDAVHAFMELLENMPINQTRWESAHSSIPTPHHFLSQV